MIAPEQFVADLLPKLRSARVTYFPIRHHSPACAAHVQRWIAEHRPASVLVEGPASFTAMIPWLVDPRCVCPVAMFTNFIDKRCRASGEEREEEGEAPDGPSRFAAYYPLCDYSPEMVALRAGHSIGSRLKFIDLEYPEMIVARRGRDDDEPGVVIDSLVADAHLKHSEYLQALARRLGCRDFNELWDHLFESACDTLETAAFMDRMAAWCAMARLDYDDATLVRDGTVAREACMAAQVRAELATLADEERPGPVLVVTGGFHTVALPDLVARETPRPKPLVLSPGETGNWLMRYSFDRLDALAGYSAGMPSPAFHDRMWSAAAAGSDAAARNEARLRAAADLIVDVGRRNRERNLPNVISTPDAMAALHMTREIAAMRGHTWPLREDVLDGIRACFVKGELESEGRVLMSLVAEILAGDRVGQVPPETGLPPIVHDFLREARALRLPVDQVEQREIELDLYRNANHRKISRLCHRLEFLSVPFAAFLAGPDFVQGHGLERIKEVWNVRWSPTTESALIEASVFGPTVEDAAGGKLMIEIARMDDEAQGRCTQTAVQLLVRALRLGLHSQAAAIVGRIGGHIAEDPSFPSLVSGLSQLELVFCSREPLEAGGLEAVPVLATAAYQRACRLAGDLAACPDDLVPAAIGGLRTLREILAGRFAGQMDDDVERLDPDLFHHGLWQIVRHPPAQAQAAVVGAAGGILFGEGRLGEEELLRIAMGYLGGARTESHKSAGILRGLLATAREVAWQLKALIQAIDAQFQSWDEVTFLKALPELRLAYADLTPREIARVAEEVAGTLGVDDLGNLIHTDLNEADVSFAVSLNQAVGQILENDGLKVERP